MTVPWSRRHSVVVDERQTSTQVWQDRFRDPALTVLLVFEICLIFLGAPLAAKGVPLARPIIEIEADHRDNDTSGRGGRRHAVPQARRDCCDIARARSDLGRLPPGSQWPPAVASVLRRGATFSRSGIARGLCAWPHYVPPPSRCGCAISECGDNFAAAFTLIWELSPAVFTSPQPRRGPGRIGHDAVFQPDYTDHNRLWRHRAGRPFARSLVYRFIQLMQLDVPSALSRRRPGSTFAVGTGFRRCSGI